MCIKYSFIHKIFFIHEINRYGLKSLNRIITNMVPIHCGFLQYLKQSLQRLQSGYFAISKLYFHEG